MENLEDKLYSIMDKMNDIQYGFVDSNKNIYPEDEKDWDNQFQQKYFLQSPEKLMKTKYGVCWDQVELERYYLQQENIKCNSYFIVNYDGKIFPTHTFILVEGGNECFWIEHSWKPYRGIHKFPTLIKALEDIGNKFNNMLERKYAIKNQETKAYQYEQPNFNIDGPTFFKHCEKGVLMENGNSRK